MGSGTSAIAGPTWPVPASSVRMRAAPVASVVSSVRTPVAGRRSAPRTTSPASSPAIRGADRIVPGIAGSNDTSRGSAVAVMARTRADADAGRAQPASTSTQASRRANFMTRSGQRAFGATLSATPLCGKGCWTSVGLLDARDLAKGPLERRVDLLLGRAEEVGLLRRAVVFAAHRRQGAEGDEVREAEGMLGRVRVGGGDREVAVVICQRDPRRVFARVLVDRRDVLVGHARRLAGGNRPPPLAQSAHGPVPFAEVLQEP